MQKTCLKLIRCEKKFYPHVLSRMPRPAGQASVSLRETETQIRQCLLMGRWRRHVATEKLTRTQAKLGWS